MRQMRRSVLYGFTAETGQKLDKRDMPPTMGKGAPKGQRDRNRLNWFNRLGNRSQTMGQEAGSDEDGNGIKN
jgi:hypothetical protein